MTRQIATAWLAGILMCGWALAQGADPALASVMSAYVIETDAEGVETRRAAETIEPGQLIEYELSVKNVSDGVLQNVTLPAVVPTATVYVAGSAMLEPTKPTFSIDGGKTYHPEPVTYVVETADGGKEERVATPEMYNGLRWQMERLQPGQEVVLRYRVRVK